MIFTLCSVFLVLFDQFLKFLIEQNIDLFNSFILIPKILKITHLKNYGAAFGILFNMRLFLIFITALVLAIFIWLILKLKISKFYYLFSFSMLLSGGVGNLIDRIFKGYVTDYCDLIFWPFEGFAVFNFADFLTTTGCVMLFLKILFSDDDFNKLLNRLFEKNRKKG